MSPEPEVGRRGHKFENAFFLKSDVRFLKFFCSAGATHLTDVNEIWQDEGD